MCCFWSFPLALWRTSSTGQRHCASAWWVFGFQHPSLQVHNDVSVNSPRVNGTGLYSTCMQNFVALVPLALMLGEVTEDLALRFGDTIGGLLNATFGNA
jgi:hypothetical protein